MKTITFKDTNETFNIMIEDERFMVCSRVYTVEESQKEVQEWNKKQKEYLKDCFNYQDKYTDFEEWEDDKKSTWLESIQNFNYEQGERPTEYDKDTQCYTLVDKVKQIRGADNYYTKYDYLNKDECKEALSELNKALDHNIGDFRISHRNNIPLSEYEIKEL